jgi:acyl-CoA synthetase (AMP-forming)/AMP-acid ligase II
MMPTNGSQPFLPEIISLDGKWRERHPAALTSGDVLNWAILDACTARVAGGLIDAGLKKGDRVGIVTSNGAAMLEILLGTMKAGAVELRDALPRDATGKLLRRELREPYWRGGAPMPADAPGHRCGFRGIAGVGRAPDFWNPELARRSRSSSRTPSKPRRRR